MGRRPYYRTWIPAAAEERVINTFPGGEKQVAEYWLGGAIVGYRHFHESGEVSWDRPMRNGRLHGMVYRLDKPGVMLSAEPYQNGLPHGTARQWADDGRLIGTYTMRRGSGIDLWWQDYQDGTVLLTEVHPMKDGMPHGFEWWFSGGTIWLERHWWHGEVHGIERQWSGERALSRGYPKYWIHGEPVDKRRYVRAALRDSSLPPFRIEENTPQRELPSELERVLHGGAAHE